MVSMITGFLTSKLGIAIVLGTILIGIIVFQRITVNNLRNDVTKLELAVKERDQMIKEWEYSYNQLKKGYEIQVTTIKRLKNENAGLHEELAQQLFLCDRRVDRIKKQYEYCCNATNTSISDIEEQNPDMLIIDGETNEKFKNLYNRSLTTDRP